MTYSRMNNENSTEVVPGSNGQSFNDVTCFGCGFLGHYRNQCSHVQRGGIVSIHMEHMFTQGNSLFRIPNSWRLLDKCSTCNVIKNPNLVKNIYDCYSEERLTAYTNGGAQHYSQMAKLILLPLDIHFK